MLGPLVTKPGYAYLATFWSVHGPSLTDFPPEGLLVFIPPTVRRTLRKIKGIWAS